MYSSKCSKQSQLLFFIFGFFLGFFFFSGDPRLPGKKRAGIADLPRQSVPHFLPNQPTEVATAVGFHQDPTTARTKISAHHSSKQASPSGLPQPPRERMEATNQNLTAFPKIELHYLHSSSDVTKAVFVSVVWQHDTRRETLP